MGSVSMSVERNLILAQFEEYVHLLQTLVNANVKQKVTLTDATAKIRKLLDSDRSIDRSDYSEKISKLTREV